MRLHQLREAAQLDDAYTVYVSGWADSPKLTIPTWGMVRLFYTGGHAQVVDGEFVGDTPHYIFQMISGDRPGAGTVSASPTTS